MPPLIFHSSTPPTYRINQITLISGVPASGKTFFGDWLRDKKDFVHIDMESFHGSFSHRIWEAALQLGELELFRDYLRERSPDVVLTWGFAMTDFPIVQRLRDIGIVPYWFRARLDWARETFLSRPHGAIEAFEKQAEEIQTQQAVLEAFYGTATLETLVAPRDYIRPETLYESMFRTR